MYNTHSAELPVRRQAPGLVDQVVEVERGAACLGFRVALQHRGREAHQRHGRLHDVGAPQLCPKRDEAAARAIEDRLQLRVCSL